MICCTNWRVVFESGSLGRVILKCRSFGISRGHQSDEFRDDIRGRNREFSNLKPQFARSSYSLVDSVPGDGLQLEAAPWSAGAAATLST